MLLNSIYVFLVIYVFAVFDIGSTTRNEDFLTKVTSCCQFAIMEVLKQRNPNCKAIGRRAPSGMICRTSAELCCVKQLQETLCKRGRAVAIDGGSCNMQATSSYGREDHQECCYCCYLGIESKRKNMGCRSSAVLGFPCQKAFSSCCLMDNPHPLGLPAGIFGSTITTTAPRTCSNLGCSQSCVVLNGAPTCVCRNGFELNVNGRTCNDVNECARGAVCNQNKVCKNTYGSHECVQGSQIVTVAPTIRCPLGLEVDPERRQCRDINECETSPCQPAEECQNSIGSYTCNPRCPSTYVFNNGRCERTCPSGYRWDSQRCRDIDECQRSGICQSNERCQNTAGSYKCVTRVNDCSQGYERVRGRCVDVDECVTLRKYRPCGAKICINIPGSYRCAQCNEGYEFVNSRCRAIRICGTSRDDCNENARCTNTGPGQYRCTCNQGYTGNGKRCEDINECNAVRNPCRSGQTCENVPGSYRCGCPTGYRLRSSRCYDINECNTNRNACPSGQSCENVPGSYRCRCPRGYRLYDSKCYDINECIQNLCASNETCINRPGTYRCVTKSKCPPGYRTQRGTCVDVNECLESRRRCSRDQVCVNTRGSYQCRVKCSSGYETDPSNNDCRDIDECANGNPCGSNRQCQNLPGTYRCITVQRCQSGYEFNNGRCQDKDECIIYNICPQDRPLCENIPGSYRCNYPRCPDGFERGRDRRCHDIDECATGIHTCRAKTEKCININGTYSCRCNPGYYRRGQEVHCRDKDECSDSTQYCAHKCVNTDGSYRCECKNGYTLVNRVNCFDVNECREGIAGCEQVCVNSQGSYHCECNRGYQLRRNKKSCVDIDECSQPKYRTGCKWKCVNTGGGYRCSCPRGYRLYSRKFCVDIDECNNRRNPCGGGSQCVNTAGGFECYRAVCPNTRHFVKRMQTHCSRKLCDPSDSECLQETRKSIRWYAQAFRDGAPVGAFEFSYNITTTGYQSRPLVKFSIRRGNDDNAFEVINHSYGKSFVRNRNVLRGPKRYLMEYRGEVIYQGQVTATFVTNLYVYVSRYDF